MIGPPIDAEYWSNASGMSTAPTRDSVDGVTQVATDGGQKFLLENPFACIPPGRPRSKASPCSSFVPDFVTMFNAGPAVQPNSEENAFDSAVISCTAPIG